MELEDISIGAKVRRRLKKPERTRTSCSLLFRARLPPSLPPPPHGLSPLARANGAKYPVIYRSSRAYRAPLIPHASGNINPTKRNPAGAFLGKRSSRRNFLSFLEWRRDLSKIKVASSRAELGVTASYRHWIISRPIVQAIADRGKICRASRNKRG